MHLYCIIVFGSTHITHKYSNPCQRTQVLHNTGNNNNNNNLTVQRWYSRVCSCCYNTAFIRRDLAVALRYPEQIAVQIYSQYSSILVLYYAHMRILYGWTNPYTYTYIRRCIYRTANRPFEV